MQIELKKWQYRVNFLFFSPILFLLLGCDQSDTVVSPDIDSFDQTLIISNETIDFQTINSSPFSQSKINTDSRILLSIHQKFKITGHEISALAHSIHLIKDTLYLDYGQSVQFGTLHLDRKRIADTLINNEAVDFTYFVSSFSGQKINLPQGFIDIFIGAKSSIFTNNNSSKRLDSFEMSFKPVESIEITNINDGKIVTKDENLVVRFNKKFTASKTIIGLSYADKNLVFRASQNRDFILIKANILNDYRLLVNETNFVTNLWVMESDLSIGQISVNEKDKTEIYNNTILMQSVHTIEIIL